MSITKVVGAVFKKDNRILAFQRNEHKKLGGKWEFPGGKIEMGESPEFALKREILEELNATIDIIEYIGETKYTYDFGTINLKLYLCDVDESKIVLNEHIDMKWVNIDDLMSLDWAPADIPILRVIEERYND